MHLQAFNLAKSFGQKVAVSDLSLDIIPGQILGLLGPNGAGKSTTIKMLSGQLKPDSGHFLLDGEKYKAIPPTLRGKIGVMPQDIIVWDDLNILENLQFTSTLQGMAKNQATQEIANLIDGLSLKPELNTIAKNLSGGYKRRLNLAISIIHSPSLIFLDEPSPGIDPQSRRFLWNFVRRLKDENRSIVLTDHYLEEAEKLADYIVIVDHGRVIASGTTAELKRKYGNGTFLKVYLNELGEHTTNLIAANFAGAAMTSDGFTLLNPKAVQELPQIMHKLDSLSLHPVQIEIKEPSLEDVFLILTGKEIRE
jgi:ABC-2 type transport system ATP-binding protein